MEESELDVVRRAKQGDHAAFGQLVQRYRRPVLRFLYGMVGRRDAAEDLVQEAISRAFRLLPNLREEAKFSTWLFGIAKNTAREKSRRLRSNGWINLDNPVADKLTDPKPGPEIDAMQQQLFRAINKGFASLDEDRRTVLALRVLGDKSYQQIAEITGWSLSRVKIEIHRARIEMRKSVEPYWGS